MSIKVAASQGSWKRHWPLDSSQPQRNYWKSHWKLWQVWIWCGGHILYNFIWDEFADWYVELTKEVLYSDNEDEKVITRSVLLYTLDQILRLLHPIMPFVTEEIYGQISEGTIVTAEYPVVRPEFENEEAAGVGSS